MTKDTFFYVKVVNAVSPKCIYINILDEDFQCFSKLNEEMQLELNQHAQKKENPEIGIVLHLLSNVLPN